ncbi:type-F conjugative transfer system mating-pair stabilization protein TraN [Klebsiella variicola]|uniref:type-F conjugative transfer system mating-pair stabilization protein TraN n=1 Tax=Klebsiella TaxID=570 RepID=UPI000D749B0A|nr:type-F conjugative transfer system mating-pair stabilization protein TraN [Klebsiella variicola]HBZ7370690.1 type-F conjugative transfer system mating-pair stabilization protein TraN [Klebsiella variicola subsp. variicola]ELY7236048.1 type-F conjugative transfer system mating-pair stabilization protein TraN [Klebsiella variicola]PXM16124.1 type-F conjugative transfer system mating-pair stabilization protein TraN [Klebsiella variicola]HDF2349294.1 type-F conjugative transfer system mating-pai
MKTVISVLTAHFFVLSAFIWLASPACADSGSDYKAGSDFAKQVQGNGLNSLKNFSGEQNLPGYTDTPDQTKYYGGVTASGDSSLKSDSALEFSQGDTGKTITESFTNRPPDQISQDAPFIQAAKDTESRADSIVGDTGQSCTAQVVNRSEFTNHTCERDLQVENFCTREATLKDNATTQKVNRTYQQVVTLNYARSTRQWSGNLTIPTNGRLLNASVDGEPMVIPWIEECDAEGKVRDSCKSAVSESLTLFERTLPIDVISWPRSESICSGGQNTHCTKYTYDGQGKIHQSFGVDKAVTAGQNFAVSKISRTVSSASQKPVQVTVTLVMEETETVYAPEVIWVESCPFSKDEGKKTGEECISPGGTRTITLGGRDYSFTEACWKYKDTWLTQPADNGSCESLMKNTACTLSSRQCAFSSEEGTCLHEYATYSCETRTSGKQMICGGDVFCLDGECDKATSGKSNDFGQAVSELAALAAAGKDVAALNGVDVRAFTGKAKFCKKFAAGFSNCCKDSGWGQDVGLARCSSEEKALAKAKKDKLTVSIGEFCSKKVLGICLEKKRSYCQFDSKLAQIVQQQGRNGQLHIGFGGASSPDCRGITVAELQGIDFNKLDFTNFMDDLMKNQKIPENDVLTNKTRERIKEIMSQQSAQ